MELIGRLALDYPRAMYWSGQALVMVAMTTALFILGAGDGVMSAFSGAGEADASGSLLGRISGALILALIIATFWRAASLLPRRQQIIVSWVTLFALLLAFFYSTSSTSACRSLASSSTRSRQGSWRCRSATAPI